MISHDLIASYDRCMSMCRPRKLSLLLGEAVVVPTCNQDALWGIEGPRLAISSCKAYVATASDSVFTQETNAV